MGVTLVNPVSNANYGHLLKKKTTHLLGIVLGVGSTTGSDVFRASSDGKFTRFKTLVNGTVSRTQGFYRRCNVDNCSLQKWFVQLHEY